MYSSRLRFLTTFMISVALVQVGSIPALAQPSAHIANTGAPCNMPFVDPSLTGSHCSSFHYDFDACTGSGGDVTFQQVSGPGTIDAVTGDWTWSPVPVSSSGQSFTVMVRPIEAGVGPGPSVSMTVTVSADVQPLIASGCSMTTMLTGQNVSTQMTYSQSDCDAVTWQASLLVGDTGTQVSIDQNGLASFSAKVPGLYAVRVIIDDGMLRDTCDHGYVVNGGPGCCVGMRGNINGHGGVDLSDLALLIAYLNVPATVLPCVDGANVNASGIVDIADLARLVSFLTSGQPSLVSCP